MKGEGFAGGEGARGHRGDGETAAVGGEAPAGLGRLWAVGVGPGDPELLTRRAERVIASADVVAAPRRGRREPSFALGVVEHLLERRRQEVLELTFPMTRSAESLERAWAENAAAVAARLRAGRTCVFVCEGDPSLYSTFLRLWDRLRRELPGLEAEVVPGVSSLMAAAARAGMPLATGEEALAVLPEVPTPAELDWLLRRFATVAVLKGGKRRDDLLAAWRAAGSPGRLAWVRRATTPAEEVHTEPEAIASAADDYFSLGLVRREGVAWREPGEEAGGAGRPAPGGEGRGGEGAAGAGAGAVWFVGAGPGAPDLITVRGRRLLAEADLVVYTDSLLDEGILRWVRPGAEVLGSSDRTLEELVDLMAAAAQAGKRVVRLHTGDPTLYGALHEQLEALRARGVPCRVVPGVTAATAAAASLGVELTMPEVAQTVILTRAAGRTPVPPGEELVGLARHGATMCLYLSAGLLEEAVTRLLEGGYPPETPAAVVQRATWPDERILRGNLADIAALARAAGVRSHAVVLVGPALGAGDGRRSRLYDPTFSHGRRPARVPWRADEEGCLPAGPGPHGAEGGPATTRDPGRVVLVAITRHGARLAGRLLASLPGVQLHVAERFRGEAEAAWRVAVAPGDGPAGGQDGPPAENGRAAVVPFAEPLGRRLARLFPEASGLVAFVSLGALVRLLAPLVRDKASDPGVVAVDDAGRFAVAALSGHLGGGNELARRVAAALGATPVITTASDARGTLAVDLLGREWGWRLEEGGDVTAVSAAVVNEDPVGVYQEAGRRDWWPDGPLPPNVTLHPSLEALAAARPAAAIVISDRILDRAALGCPAVVLRPPTLALGVGLHRGVRAEEVLEAFRITLREAGFSPLSVAAVGTLADRAEEPGLAAAARALGCRVLGFPAAELDRVAGRLPGGSELVAGYVGTRGVCEPAAVLAALAVAEAVGGERQARATPYGGCPGSGAGAPPDAVRPGRAGEVPEAPRLLAAPKRKFANVTVAVARRAEDEGGATREL